MREKTFLHHEIINGKNIILTVKFTLFDYTTTDPISGWIGQFSDEVLVVGDETIPEIDTSELVAELTSPKDKGLWHLWRVWRSDQSD